MSTLEKLTTTRQKEHELEQLSPFELKDNLIELASDRQKKSSLTMLNAGRGNPNWICTMARQAFFTLGRFGIEECRRQMDDPSGMAGIPEIGGLGGRLRDFLEKNSDMEGAGLLREVFEYGIKTHGFAEDDWALELTEGVMGDQYPVPVRMLKCCEQVVHDYIVKEMCDGKPSVGGRWDLFATEGGTAAMCYLFDSLKQNGLLKTGDKIAIGVPIFTPYLEIPVLDTYGFNVTYIHGNGRDENGSYNLQYTDSELDKLGDPSVKAFFIVNPSNPTSVMISQESRRYLVNVVKEKNPNLMILTDDVYGTFVPGFQSLMNDLPANTLCVYSFSKYFGATGWRLGVIALYEDNIYDKMLAELPEQEKKRQAKLYESLTLEPQKLKFIDRLVADSRDVALNHTAGLSTPQQIQMMLFAGFALLDRENRYKQASIELLRHRYQLLWDGLKIKVISDPNRASYYSEFDIQDWAVTNYGQDFFDWLQKNFEPVDMVFRLSERCAVVLLNGGGFAGPEWSIRVSLANLDDEDYSRIGRIVSNTLAEYVETWQRETGREVTAQGISCS
ncbi:MAG: bifunctional aspartate transaminase/aspartate 4-decarboxylase [Rikenellaceae bacterium]|nr:bifunctional aspartate transaminase/aspartate 4-decarboxylase [Rikenellaceae bacterium]